MEYSVSVVIPVKNEAAKIRACLNGILEQTIPVKEIIVLDSGSTDGTLDILTAYPIVKVIHIKPEEFNHGETRNIGVQNATGNFVVLTVGDARPVNEFWLEHLMKGFEDEKVAGVCGQQVVPHEKDKNPLDWFKPTGEPLYKRYEFSGEAEFYNLTPEERKNACSWDDVSAAYRREILLQNPFEKTSFGEDMIWAKQILLKGYALVYNFSARVYHYHLQDEKYAFKRAFTTQYFRYKLFGFLHTVPSYALMDDLRMTKTLLFEKRIGGIKRRFGWLQYNRGQNRAVSSSVEEFHRALQKGEDYLDKKHAELCGKTFTPPK